MKKRVGIEINMPEGSKIVKIPIAEDVQQYLKETLFPIKGYNEYIKEFLLTERNFETVNEAVKKAMHESLPKNLTDSCKFCMGETDDETEKACLKYTLQMQITYSIAATEFVNLILSHQHIFESKKLLLNLTLDFFKCLNFIAGKGIMYFDLDLLCRYFINAGHQAVAKIFAKSDVLNNLQIINQHINYFEDKRLENDLLNKEDQDYLDLQQRFFENKQRFYKEKLILEEQELKKTKQNKTKKIAKEITIPVLALYYYYLQAAGDFPYFENHSEGKLKAIENLIKQDNIITTAKYFQIKYNHISNHKSNRIAKNQSFNIDFVANKMLSNYPKAKEIALSELVLAQTKNR